MLGKLKIEEVLFLDIETVPQFSSYAALPPVFSALWDAKSAQFRKPDQTPETVYERAGIYAEFGKIICISVGYLFRSGGTAPQARLKSFYGHDEKTILASFCALLENRARQGMPPWIFCAHNGREFDFPYISRRLLIHGLGLPPELDFAGKKPWEIGHLDTMELWKFGDYKHFTSLSLLAAIFDIPTPKDDIDGSQVGRVYWEEGNLERIARYCEKDVLAIIRLLQKMKGENPIPDAAVTSTTWA